MYKTKFAIFLIFLDFLRSYFLSRLSIGKVIGIPSLYRLWPVGTLLKHCKDLKYYD